MSLRRSACAALCFLGFGGAVLLAAAQPAAAQSKGWEAVQKPCAAAKAPVRWGTALRVPADVRGKVTKYRAGWAQACAAGGGANLGALLAMADTISARLEKLLSQQLAKGDAADRQHLVLFDVYPTFLPAIIGSIIEYEYVRPMLFVYAANAKLGDAEDRAFFAAHGTLFGGDWKAPVWITRTWDYGGCPKLGSYDFATALATLDKTRAATKRPAYQRRLAEWENRAKGFFESLTGAPYNKKGVLYTCEKPAAVVANLTKALGAVDKREGFAKAAVSLRTVLAGLKSGALKIKKGDGRGG